MKNMHLFRAFLNTGLKHYVNVEIVVNILCDAATCMSVESVVESWVSVYEAQSNKRRPISNDRAEQELCLAVNGPLLQHADAVIKANLVETEDSKDIRNRVGKFKI